MNENELKPESENTELFETTDTESYLDHESEDNDIPLSDTNGSDSSEGSTEAIQTESTPDKIQNSKREKLKKYLPHLAIAFVVILSGYVMWEWMPAAHRGSSQSPNQKSVNMIKDGKKNITAGQNTESLYAINSTVPQDLDTKDKLEQVVMNLQQNQAQFAEDIQNIYKKINELESIIKNDQPAKNQEVTERILALDGIVKQQGATLDNRMADVSTRITALKQAQVVSDQNYQKTMQQAQDKLMKAEQQIPKKAENWKLLGSTQNSAVIQTAEGQVIPVKVGDSVYGLGTVTEISSERIIVGHYFIN